MTEGKKLTKLMLYRRKVKDPYTNFYTNIEVFVPKPTRDYPLPCVLISVHNSRQSLFFRVADIKALKRALLVPRRAVKKIEEALLKAYQESDEIEKEMEMMFKLKKSPLSPGAKVVRTDTGEIIAEAERILNHKPN